MSTKNINRHANFYALLNQMGMSAKDKRSFIIEFTDGVTDSLTELWEKYPAFYHDMIRHMENHVKQIQKNNKHSEADKLRKKVIASIGGYFKLTGQDHTIDTIKGTACKATGYDDFNRIPKERLRNIYNAFLKMQKDFKAVDEINHELLTKMIFLN